MARMVNDGAPDLSYRLLAKKMDGECHTKAVAKGLMTFTLIETDPTSPDTILFWIWLNLRTCPIPKLRDAFEDALAMLTTPKPKKNAD
ncbi:MAG TPA: hypothetical protein VJY15_12010 [Candidatus Acidoferrum sp.]|nr:hypothetical protein [Candidatus Acidoferrum sp.]